jgi:hypothetical protein
LQFGEVGVLQIEHRELIDENVENFDRLLNEMMFLQDSSNHYSEHAEDMRHHH